MCEADWLFLLTDVPCMYDKNPRVSIQIVWIAQEVACPTLNPNLSPLVFRIVLMPSQFMS